MLRAIIEKRLRPVDPGIVDEDVEAGETGDRGPRGFAVGHVERQRARPPALRLDLRRDRRQLGLGAAVEQQFGPGLAKRQRHRAADAAPGAGDQRDLSVHNAHGLPQ
jgi:hypothetical protein